MKWLEIISLRTAGINENEARTYLKKFCRIVEKHNLSKADFYVHSSIPGDFALVITSETEKDKVMGTDMAKYAADILRQFGLVDYNCWQLGDYE